MAAPIRDDEDWFVLEVMRKDQRKWRWVVLLVDVDPDDLRRGNAAPYRQRWASIPGKHRTRKSAVAALENMLATRH